MKMIKKNILLPILLIMFLPFYSQYKLPENSAEKNKISNWIIGKELDFKNERINELLENPELYFGGLKANQIKELNLSKYGSSVMSLNQLYSDIDFKTTFIIASEIIANSSQNIGLTIGNVDLDIVMYINGEQVYSEYMDNKSYFDYELKKGANKIILVGKANGNYGSMFALRILNNNLGQLKVKISKENGENHSNGRFVIKGEKLSQYFQLDKKGEKKQWLKPGVYQIGCSIEDGAKYSWSKKIKIKEKQTGSLNLILSKQSKITGKVFTMDGKTPHAGIILNLIDAENSEMFSSEITDLDGNYSFTPPLGKWSINVKTNQSGDNISVKKNIEINSNTKKIENINFKVSKQINGSWDKITMFDGMLSPSILESLVSEDDLLYIGTFNGLSIYDGTKIKNFNYEDGLPNDLITEIFEDEDGFIWIGYDKNGMIKFKNGEIINHFTKENGLPSNNVRAISQDKNGNILIGTDAGFSIMKNEKFENFDFTNGIGNGYVSEIIVFGNSIWIGTSGGEISVFNGKKFKALHFDIFTNTYWNGMNINVIKKDNNDNIWIGSEGGLLKYNGIKFEIFRTENGLPSNVVKDILLDDNGVWVATSKGLVNIKNERVIVVISDQKDELNFTSINSISKSKDGIYFISTGKGVYKYDPNSFKTISASEGLEPNEVIWDIIMDNDGFLWAGGIKGLYKIQNGLVIEKFNKKKYPEMPNNMVFDIEIAKDGSLWMAQNNLITRYNDGEIKNMSTILNIPPNTYIRDILFDDNETLWIASNRGLGKFKNDTLIFFDESKGTVRPVLNSGVSLGNNGEIIYYNYGSGFSVFDGLTFQNYNIKNGLSNNNVEEISVDSKNNYWIALDGAAVQMFDGEKFYNHKIKDGVSSDEIWNIYVDDFDIVWAGTYGGGICFYDGNVWNSIDSRDGLHHNTIRSIYSLNGNKYWFGSFNGITTYEPKHQTPTVFIDNIETSNGIFDSFEEIKEKFLVDTRIKIILNSNSFNTKKDKQKFLVKVTRKDSTNKYLTNSNEFVFLPKKTGKYELEFQSVDRDINYSKPLKLNISIVGPWYSNLATAIPFWGGLLLLVSFCIYTFRKYISQRRYTLKLKEEAQIKDREARERLEEKNKEILDSINYAKRIQSAILPSNRAVKAYLKDSFVLYKPKDVIAGDFYWLEYHDNKTYFAAADCTGHGVPGAMISLVCNNALNRSVREYNLTDPGKILDNTKELVVEEFGHSEENVKDGMDIALCCIEGNKLKYAGAFNPLWMVRDNKLTKIGADRQPIGSFEYSKPFKSHEIQLKKGDSIYVFSDGFVDQFGGARGKKYKSLKFQDFLLSIQEENMRKQRELLNKEIEDWRGDLEQIDDICIMGVRV